MNIINVGLLCTLNTLLTGVVFLGSQGAFQKLGHTNSLKESQLYSKMINCTALYSGAYCASILYTAGAIVGGFNSDNQITECALLAPSIVFTGGALFMMNNVLEVIKESRSR